MKIQIKNRFNETVIFETDAESLGAAVIAAIAAKVNLYGANLGGANLYGANLYGAYLRSANLSTDELAKLLNQRTILPEGDLIVWKKVRATASSGETVLVKLKIPAAAKRVGGLVGRKCRAEYAEVLEGSGFSDWDRDIEYSPGRTVRPDQFDPNPLLECSNGIHFFITKAEAEAYSL